MTGEMQSKETPFIGSGSRRPAGAAEDDDVTHTMSRNQESQINQPETLTFGPVRWNDTSFNLRFSGPEALADGTTLSEDLDMDPCAGSDRDLERTSRIEGRGNDEPSWLRGDEGCDDGMHLEESGQQDAFDEDSLDIAQFITMAQQPARSPAEDQDMEGSTSDGTGSAGKGIGFSRVLKAWEEAKEEQRAKACADRDVEMDGQREGSEDGDRSGDESEVYKASGSSGRGATQAPFALAIPARRRMRSGDQETTPGRHAYTTGYPTKTYQGIDNPTPSNQVPFYHPGNSDKASFMDTTPADQPAMAGQRQAGGGTNDASTPAIASDATVATGSVVKIYAGDVATGRMDGQHGGNVVGFANLGNTCYQSSIIQALLATAPLRRLLSLHKAGKTCPTFCLTCNLRDTAIAVAQGTSGEAIELASLAAHIQYVCPTMRRGRQEDAHELLVCVLDRLHEEELVRTGNRQSSDEVKQTTHLKQVFEGALSSLVVCQVCQQRSESTEAFNNLSINVSRDGGTVQMGLGLMMATEMMDGDNAYLCSRCNLKRRAERSFSVSSAPTILAIHLKRFDSFGDKIDHPISMGDDITLGSKWYELYAVVHHTGATATSGHYLTDVKKADGTWTRYDDQAVLETNLAGSSRDGYVLLYARMSGARSKMAADTRNLNDVVPFDAIDGPSASPSRADLPVRAHGRRSSDRLAGTAAAQTTVLSAILAREFAQGMLRVRQTRLPLPDMPVIKAGTESSSDAVYAGGPEGAVGASDTPEFFEWTAAMASRESRRRMADWKLISTELKSLFTEYHTARPLGRPDSAEALIEQSRAHDSVLGGTPQYLQAWTLLQPHHRMLNALATDALFDPVEWHESWESVDQRVTTNKPPKYMEYYIRVVRFSCPADLQVAAKRYAIAHPQDVVQAVLWAAQAGATHRFCLDILQAALSPWIPYPAAKSGEFDRRADTIINILYYRTWIYVSGRSAKQASSRLLYGGQTGTGDPWGRNEADAAAHGRRIADFIRSNEILAQDIDVFKLKDIRFVVGDASDFRRRPILGEVEAILVDCIPGGSKLNSARGGYLDTFAPPSDLLGLRDKVLTRLRTLDVDAAPITENATKKDLLRRALGDQLAFTARQRAAGASVGQAMCTRARRDTEEAITSYEEVAGEVVSINLLKDVTREMLDGSVGGLASEEIGQAFDSWRHELTWIVQELWTLRYELWTAGRSLSLTTQMIARSFGCYVDIWICTLVHLGYGIWMIFVWRYLAILRPLHIMAWSGLNAFALHQTEAFFRIVDGVDPELLRKFVEVDSPTTTAILSRFNAVPGGAMRSSLFAEATGSIAIGRYGQAGYALVVCQPHLGSRKYKAILRRTSSEQSFHVRLVNKVVNSVLKAGLASDRLDRTDPAALLPWLQRRRSEANEILQATGLARSLRESTDAACRLSRCINILTNGSRTSLEQANVSTGIDIDVNSSDEDEDEDSSRPGNGKVPHDTTRVTAALVRGSGKHFASLEEGVADVRCAALEESASAALDLVLEGTSRSAERLAQLEVLQEELSSRHARGLVPLDPYLISSEVRPISGAGMISLALRTAFLQAKPNVNLRNSANGAGRTLEASTVNQHRLAKGLAKLNAKFRDPVWVRENFGQRGQDEISDSLTTLANSAELARLPSDPMRPAFSVAEEHSRTLRSATCPHCGWIIWKNGHPAQQHFCWARGQFDYFTTTLYPDLRRYRFLHDVLESCAVDTVQEDFARVAVSACYFEPVAQAIARYPDRLPQDVFEFGASLSDLVFCLSSVPTGEREEWLFVQAVDILLKKMPSSPQPNLTGATHAELSKHTVPTNDVIRFFSRDGAKVLEKNKKMLAVQKHEPKKRHANERRPSNFDASFRMIQCRKGCGYVKLQLPATTIQHACPGETTKTTVFDAVSAVTTFWQLPRHVARDLWSSHHLTESLAINPLDWNPTQPWPESKGRGGPKGPRAPRVQSKEKKKSKKAGRKEDSSEHGGPSEKGENE